MNTKPTNGQSVSSKSGININMPSFAPTSQWQGTSVSYMPLIGNQLMQMPPPGINRQPLWGPPQPYPYYSGPQMSGPYGPMAGPPPPHHCCMNAYNNCRPVADHNCNNWGAGSAAHNGGNCWAHREDTPTPATNGASIIESITEIRNDDSDNESTKSAKKGSDLQKQVKQMKAINKGLKNSLEETTTQLNETQESLLKINEKLAIDYIEKYQKNLKKYGGYIRGECNRFVQNPTIAEKLKPIVEQMKTASKKAIDEKERLKKLFADKRESIKDEVNADFDDVDFDPNSLPEFPDLLEFYKSILDEIPIIFFNDLSQIKRFATNCVQPTDNKVSDNSKPIKTSRFSPPLPSLSIKDTPLPSFSIKDTPFPSLSTKDNLMPSISKPQFSIAPTIKELPKPDFPMFDSSMNTLPLKPAEPVVSSALELTFPRSHSPVPAMSLLSNTSTDALLKSSVPLANGIQSTIGSELSAIGEPVLKKHVSSVKAVEPEGDFRLPRHPPIFGTKAMPSNTNTTAAVDMLSPPKSSTPPITASTAPKAPLNQAQSKLLAKLKEKYGQLSDEILVDSMAQTKAALINSGSHPKGFTGMKISEIVSRISDYIDRNVVLMNSFSKTRIHGPIPTLKLMTDNLTDALNSSQKGWTKVSHKKGTNDDLICSICMEAMFITDRYETECHHYFHKECISSWTRTDGSCPICRSHVLPPGEYPVL